MGPNFTLAQLDTYRKDKVLTRELHAQILKQFSSEVVKVIDGITFNAETTEYNTAWIDAWFYDYLMIHLEMSQSGWGAASGALQFYLQFTPDDGTTILTYEQDFWAALIYTDDSIGGSGRKVSLEKRGLGRKFRIRVVATNTDASNTFTVTANTEMKR